jgi:hypothetical protein
MVGAMSDVDDDLIEDCKSSNSKQHHIHLGQASSIVVGSGR